MKQSQLFTKTRKETPADEVAKNAQLLIQAGYIHKEMAGVYSFLPLGLRVVNKISKIVREEMDAIGGEEIKLTILQDSEVWKSSQRWSEEVSDAWFKTKLKNDTELGLGWTHEEPLTRIMKNFIRSYRDLPAYPYQIQGKLRNETRAKSGIMRGREFLMKDLYSFSKDQAEHDEFYEKVKQAYLNVFQRVGLGDKTFLTFASGGAFSKYSHEFQTLVEAGEDTIYLSRDKKLAVNKEVYNDEVLKELGLAKDELEEVSAAEVGNIFTLGTRFSEPLGLVFEDEKGEKKPVVMGSYGLGPTRVMGVLVEAMADEKGLVWPEAIAPFAVHIVALGDATGKAEELYSDLTKKGVEVLFDDRDISPGKKLGDSDLLGIPTRVVVSEKSMAAGGVEITDRASGKSEILASEALFARLA